MSCRKVITQVLDASSSGTHQWQSIIKKLPVLMRDSYFYPDWVLLHRFNSDTRALMFTCEKQGKIWAYPFLLVSINYVGEKKLEQTWYDIETSYGYGGPLCNTADTQFFIEAYTLFTEWCNTNKVVAEFVRFHPLIQNINWLDSDTEIIWDRDTVSLDFRRINKSVLPFDTKTRNMLKRADKLNVNIRQTSEYDDYIRFVEMYKSSMDRVQAENYLYFSDEYFDKLFDFVRKSGCLLFAKHNEQYVSGAVFVYGSTWMHYHLAASDPDRMISGANNQLLMEAAKIGKQLGLKGLHLGGGRTNDPNDSLLKFKRSMSTDRHKYFIGRRIHRPDVYKYLTNLWREQYPALVHKYGKRLLCYHYN